MDIIIGVVTVEYIPLPGEGPIKQRPKFPTMSITLTLPAPKANEVLATYKLKIGSNKAGNLSDLVQLTYSRNLHLHTVRARPMIESAAMEEALNTPRPRMELPCRIQVIRSPTTGDHPMVHLCGFLQMHAAQHLHKPESQLIGMPKEQVAAMMKQAAMAQMLDIDNIGSLNPYDNTHMVCFASTESRINFQQSDYAICRYRYRDHTTHTDLFLVLPVHRIYHTHTVLYYRSKDFCIVLAPHTTLDAMSRGALWWVQKETSLAADVFNTFLHLPRKALQVLQKRQPAADLLFIGDSWGVVSNTELLEQPQKIHQVPRMEVGAPLDQLTEQELAVYIGRDNNKTIMVTATPLTRALILRMHPGAQGVTPNSTLPKLVVAPDMIPAQFRGTLQKTTLDMTFPENQVPMSELIAMQVSIFPKLPILSNIRTYCPYIRHHNRKELLLKRLLMQILELPSKEDHMLEHLLVDGREGKTIRPLHAISIPVFMVNKARQLFLDTITSSLNTTVDISRTVVQQDNLGIVDFMDQLNNWAQVEEEEVEDSQMDGGEDGGEGGQNYQPSPPRGNLSAAEAIRSRMMILSPRALEQVGQELDRLRANHQREQEQEREQQEMFARHQEEINFRQAELQQQ